MEEEEGRHGGGVPVVPSVSGKPEIRSWKCETQLKVGWCGGVHGGQRMTTLASAPPTKFTGTPSMSSGIKCKKSLNIAYKGLTQRMDSLDSSASHRQFTETEFVAIARGEGEEKRRRRKLEKESKHLPYGTCRSSPQCRNLNCQARIRNGGDILDIAELGTEVIFNPTYIYGGNIRNQDECKMETMTVIRRLVRNLDEQSICINEVRKLNVI
ncbi:uncharacterized protein LOC122092914 [Macadamia integrifolia]|uniref:uncharacterized protein LOC122092914 n=1 Tax=Macadamia integrifolia TaxID=60698 RepID=UPI001C533C42|nr:uncharacterized protein LOC122092914 [Macadamia integrifolia]